MIESAASTLSVHITYFCPSAHAHCVLQYNATCEGDKMSIPTNYHTAMYPPFFTAKTMTITMVGISFELWRGKNDEESSLKMIKGDDAIDISGEQMSLNPHA